MQKMRCLLCISDCRLEGHKTSAHKTSQQNPLLSGANRLTQFLPGKWLIKSRMYG